MRALRPQAQHITIYRHAEEFAGWPFNHGLWTFGGGELRVAFSRGRCAYRTTEDVQHRVVDGQYGEYVTLRSTDGGSTWPLESLQVLGTHEGLARRLTGQSGTVAPAPRLTGQSGTVAPAPRPAGQGSQEAAPVAPDRPVDFTSPDFCLTAGFGLPPRGAEHVGYVQYSRDRGQTWDGPYVIPSLGFSWVQVKPDFLVRPDGLVLLFVTVRRPGNDGTPPGSRFVAVYATTDGGLTWRYLSSILPAGPDAAFVNRYYASPVLLPGGRMVAALRCQIDGRNAWPEVFASDDGGWTWRFLSRVNDWGGPTHLSLLGDGRVLAVSGYRVPPYGIRARVSADGGQTWGPELVLRDDGGSHDLGYPRAVPLGDGRVLAAYYFNRAGDPVQCAGGVRHIAGTIFRP